MLPDYYERLGIRASASQEEIRRAYRRLAQKTHPDRNPNDEAAEARFRRLKEAYDVLGTPERRHHYDQRRNQTASAPPVTAASVGETGCVSYYLPRVGVGLLAVAAFFVVEAVDLWRMDDPRVLWTAVLGVSLGVGGLSVFLLRLAPDAPPDYAVRLSTEDVRVWAERRLVLRLAWLHVDRVSVEAASGRLNLIVRPDAVPGLAPSPPVIPSVAHGERRTRLTVDLSGTDVRHPALRRVLDAAPVSFSPPPTDAAR